MPDFPAFSLKSSHLFVCVLFLKLHIDAEEKMRN